MDGRLSAEEAAAFERMNPEAPREKTEASRIAAALRVHLPAPRLKNADFFNERILREIAPPRPHASDARSKGPALWSLWRMALAGACCLLAAAAIYKGFVDGREQPRNGYFAKVISAKAGDEQLYATVLEVDGLAVVWMDGLDNLADDYVLQ
jgi:hypothetical protein